LDSERPPIYAFVHIFKTAGTTLTGILRRNFSTRHFDTRLFHKRRPANAEDLRRIMLIYPRLVSIAGHAVRPFTDMENAYPALRFYTFLREPRSRILSAFRFGAANLVRNEGWRPTTAKEMDVVLRQTVQKRAKEMCAAFSPEKHAGPAIEMLEKKIGFVGLVERFDGSLFGMRDWMQKPDLDLRYRRMNASGDRSGKFRRKEIQPFLDRIDDFAVDAMSRSDVLDHITEATRDDQALYDHAARVRLAQRRVPGLLPTTTLEQASVGTDTIAGRAYRLLGKLIVPLVVK
jgi:hypothetical protein